MNPLQKLLPLGLQAPLVFLFRINDDKMDWIYKAEAFEVFPSYKIQTPIQSPVPLSNQLSL